MQWLVFKTYKALPFVYLNTTGTLSEMWQANVRKHNSDVIRKDVIIYSNCAVDNNNNKEFELYSLKVESKY